MKTTMEVRDHTENKAIIFDLDGVICDTAEFHFLAWKQITEEEDIYFDKIIYERLKGVSRLTGLEIILEKASRIYTEAEKKDIAKRKNNIYKEYLKHLSSESLLPGVEEFIAELKDNDYKLGICSASKNAPGILDYLGTTEWFDTIVSGNDPIEPKPHPAGFLLAAKRLKVNPHNCIVIEDAFAGIESAKKAGMKTVGIGDKKVLFNADTVLSSTQSLKLQYLETYFGKI